MSKANYAHYSLHKFYKWPSEFLALSREEKALVMADIDERIDKEKKEAAKIRKR